MTPEQRRETIVSAAIPLLIEREGNVTTGQIAAAAGIAEGTVFRAFNDKQELLAECMRVGLRAGDVVDEIAQLSLERPLDERLATAVDLVTGYMRHMWSLVQALQVAGLNRSEMHPHPGEDGEKKSTSRKPEGMIQVTRAIVELFEPERDKLRLDPRLAARMLVGLVFANRLQGEDLGQVTAPARELVELFLHGALLVTPHTKGDST